MTAARPASPARRRAAAAAALVAAAAVAHAAGTAGRDRAPHGPAVAAPAVQACPVRPLTAPAAPFFEDVSIASGIKPAVLPPGTRAHPRVRWVDIDGDGWDDIAAPTMFPGTRAGDANPQPFDWLVWRNNGDGTFRDVSEASGLKGVQAGYMAFGDFDNDGDQDAFAGLDIHNHYDMSVPRTHQILLNDGQGHFTVRARSGVEVPAGVDSTGVVYWGAGNAALGDYNGDGNLDIFVGNGQTSYALPDQLFIGSGSGTFTDRSVDLAGNPQRPSNGSTTCDVDDDGDLDIFVATYGVSVERGHNILWINDGQGRFTNEARARGVEAFEGGNTWRADMEYGKKPQGGPPETWIGSNGFGVDCDDADNDGDMDLLMATIAHSTEIPAGYRGWPQEEIDALNFTRRWADPSQLLINQGAAAGWAFSNTWQARKLPYNEGDIDAALADFDNDGRLDVGVSRDRKYDANTQYVEPDQKGWFGLYRQLDDGTFASVGFTSGINHPADPEAAARMRGSGNVNWSDYDRDGDLDLLLGGGPGASSGHLFRNTIGQANDWLAVRVVGDGEAVNRDAIGARVTLRWAGADAAGEGGPGGGEQITRQVKAGRGTYNSTDTRVLHFGLGARDCSYTLTVTFPDGTVRTFDGATIGRNRHIRIAHDGTLVDDVARDPSPTPAPTPAAPTLYLPRLARD